MMKTCWISLRMLVLLTLLTGGVYPLLITLVGHQLWPKESTGSLVYAPSGTLVGSALLAQKFTQAQYFHPRPSAADYIAVPSGASNQSGTSQAFANRVQKQRQQTGDATPAELLTTSASGLDPHLSVESVRYQVRRVGEARKLSESQLHRLQVQIHLQTTYPLLGFIGKKVVNVLLLNQALDREFP